MIVLENVAIEVGGFALREVDLRVPAGKYGMLMGRTGCGKTTVLEAIAGLKPVIKGSIHLGARNVTSMQPAQRNVGYVPQDGALFTTMSVRDQLAFSLNIRKWSKRRIEARVMELAELLGIGELLKRRLRGLSGGERQRIAIGRALAFEPDTLLLDEPLSALDDETRSQMYELLKDVQARTGVTTLHVTHHQEDVASLADIVFRIDNGDIKRQ